MRTAGKTIGSAADAITWSRVSRVRTAMRSARSQVGVSAAPCTNVTERPVVYDMALSARSEEHTSELQSQFHLVCRLLLEKKKNKQIHNLYQQSIKKIISS